MISFILNLSLKKITHNDNDYIRIGDIDCCIREDYLSNGEYIRYNNISEYNTDLCTDIIIKSKFEGGIKYYVKENDVIRKCEINDKDLLYSIELCNNPVINRSSDEINNTYFTYDVLSDDFINKIWYIGELVGENTMNDYSLVKKEMNVYKIYERGRHDNFDIIFLKALVDGIIVFNQNNAFLQNVYSGQKLFSIYKDESVLVKELFKMNYH